jgi:hypothetical protein
MTEHPGSDPGEAGVDEAPEGTSDEGRPDTDEQERALHDEDSITDPDPEQPDPESGGASA